jgi:hypothetical protein
MGLFNKPFGTFSKPMTIQPPKPPIINPASGMPMHGGIGGFDGRGNLYGQNKSPFPKPNPFPNHKF